MNQKQKGNRGERELAKILEERFNEGFSRTPSSGAWAGGKNRELRNNMGNNSKIVLTSDIITPENFKFSIEHKFYKSIDFWELFNEKSNLYSWIEQVSQDSIYAGLEPLLIVKINRHKRIAFIKDKVKGFIFNWNDFNCYWLDDLLNQNDDFWFNKK